MSWQEMFVFNYISPKVTEFQGWQKDIPKGNEMVLGDLDTLNYITGRSKGTGLKYQENESLR